MEGKMRLPARARYALCLVLEVAKRGGTRTPVRLADVAEKTGVSRKFLELVAASLKSHAILRGICGRRGGYVLTRVPEEISVRQIVEAVSGPIDFCVGTEDCSFCVRREMCHCHLLWGVFNKRILEVFDAYTVADLSRRETMDGIREELGVVNS